MNYKEYPEIGVFKDGLKELKIELTDIQIQQFMDYYELLVEWNSVMNLTSIIVFKEVIQKHFIDSLSIVKVLNLSKEKVLDIGTGAGFPGIPLKIAFPEIEIVLLDSLQKRIYFLDEVVNKLKLEKITTLHGRAEEYGKNENYREQFDLCVSRAVAKLSSLSEYCIPYVKNGGYFVPYKSGKIEEELEMSQNALNILGAKIIKTGEFSLPGTDIERKLVVIQKVSDTPSKYPRTAGKPTKSPL